jgi:hypothetical protein
VFEWCELTKVILLSKTGVEYLLGLNLSGRYTKY